MRNKIFLHKAPTIFNRQRRLTMNTDRWTNENLTVFGY